MKYVIEMNEEEYKLYEQMKEYDSTKDTLDHIRRVQELLNGFAAQLVERGRVHDTSKLGDVEKPVFDEETPLLKELEYGSDEYKESLKRLKVALDHHYANNSHHPEHYENGISGMDLLDLVEMFFDWKAATERTKDGDLAKSIEINGKRFKMSDVLISVFKNTNERLK